ncbi:MAG: hypothetical protein ABJE95_19865 [Byssovorax sp.]
MSKLDDPARLFDARSNTTDGVRAVLRSGQRGLPDPDQLARLAARLPLGPLPPPSGSPPTGSPPLAPVRLLAPIAAPSVLPGVIVGAALGLAVVAGWAWRDAASTPASNFTAPSSATNLAAPIAAPRSADSPVAIVPIEPADPARPKAAASSAPRSGMLAGASVEPPQGDAPSATDSSAPSLAGSPSGPSAALDDETEVHLLQRAQTALAANPASALALTADHARRFPGGALGQESEFIAVTALVALGRKPEAQARAASLLERFPGSAYRGRLESLGLGK